MSLPRITITRNENVQNHQNLHHPNVRKYPRFPRGYTLFEYYDPIFETTSGPDGVAIPMDKQPAKIRRCLSSAMWEERSLLSPLFEGRPKHWQANQLLLPLERGIYCVLGTERMNWPWFWSSPGWELRTRIKVSGILEQTALSVRSSLENSFSTWFAWASAQRAFISGQHLAFVRGTFSTLCEFLETAVEACIGLYLLFTVSLSQIQLRAVGFFDTSETAPKFYEMGRTGIIS
ncbi:MAG: hypothetical protein WBW14_00435 [Candidatus Acidiferrum sp.]